MPEEIVNPVKRIKVVHIITLLELGGAQENTLYTCGHLDKNRFDVILITGRGGLLDEKTKNIKTYFVKELIREICPVYDLIALLKIYKILKKEKPDIVHTHSSKAGILGRWAAYFARSGQRTKIIHTFHGFGFNDFQNYFIKKIYVFSERLTAKITDKLVAVSYENISKGLKNKIGMENRYVVIRSGIKLQNYRVDVDIEKKKKEFGLTNEKVVGMIACFKKQKSPLDFIKTAGIVCGKKTGVKFILVGDGILRSRIESEISRLNLEKNVILAGWRKDTGEILKIFDVFILTSLWEGLPRVIIESMAAGVPVVATNIDGTREIVEDGVTGFVVAPHETEKMAEKILRLLDEPGLGKEFSQAAKKRIPEFDIDMMVSRQEQLYTSLI